MDVSPCEPVRSLPLATLGAVPVTNCCLDGDSEEGSEEILFILGLIFLVDVHPDLAALVEEPGLDRADETILENHHSFSVFGWAVSLANPAVGTLPLVAIDLGHHNLA